MRRAAVFAFALVTAGAFFASAAAAADMSGAWRIQAQFAGGNASFPVCIFQQGHFQNGRGDLFVGSCKGPNFLGPANGSTQGRQVRFTWDATAFALDQESWNGVMSFSGVAGPSGTMTGSATDAKGAPGRFTATRQ